MEGLSLLSKKCRECPFVEACDHKQMEALAYMNTAGQSVMGDATGPIMRETRTVLLQGDATIVFKDEIETLKKEMCRILGVPDYLMSGR